MNSEFERFANQVKEHIFENVADRDNLLIELHNTQKVWSLHSIHFPTQGLLSRLPSC